MVRGALHLHVPPPNAHDPLHHPDLDSLRLQVAALLDVQLQEAEHAPRFTARLRQPGRVPAQAGRALADGEPRRRDDVELRRLHAANQRPAAGLAAFLVLEDDDFQGVPKFRARVAQRERRLERGRHADLAVVAAACRDRVDVRSSHQRARVRTGSAPPSDQIARQVHRHIQPRLLHDAGDVVPRGQVLVAVREARGSAVAGPAEAAQGRPDVAQPGAVHPQPARVVHAIRPRSRQPADRGRGRSQKAPSRGKLIGEERKNVHSPILGARRAGRQPVVHRGNRVGGRRRGFPWAGVLANPPVTPPPRRFPTRSAGRR